MSGVSDISKYYILIFLLIIVMFISYTYYVKTYEPLELTKEQYNFYTESRNKFGLKLTSSDEPPLPEGIAGTDDLIYAKRLGICSKNMCVMDRKTGIKRCPEKDNRLTYNIFLEVCVNENECNFEKLPYAVNTDGSSNSNILCDHPRCRCINKVLCPTKNLSSFKVTTSEFNVFENNIYDYDVTEIVPRENFSDQIGFSNIEINPRRGDTCNITPSQTQYLTSGCDFSNSDFDPIGCEETPLLPGFGELKDTVECVNSTEPNYKNMLMCTQEDREICKKGSMSYNYDQEVTSQLTENFSRRFCQQEFLGANYLNSPINNTISCTGGPGCNGYFLDKTAEEYSLSLNIDPEDRYFPKFEIDGIRNVLFGKFKQTTIYTLDSNYKNTEDFSIYKGSQNTYPEKYLEKGDAWAVSNLDTDIFVTADYEIGGTSVPVDSIFLIDTLISTNNINNTKLTFGTCETLYNLKPDDPSYYDSSKNQSYINLKEELKEKVSTNDKVNFQLDNSLKTGGYVNIEVDNDVKKITLKTFFHESPNITGDDTIYNFYKQFGFNGFNYNTVIKYDKNKNRFNRYFVEAGKEDILTPYNNKDEGLNSQLVALYSNSDFKKEFSMYYPVWNPVTFTEECIMCKPNLIAYPILGQSGSIENIYIQYSGKDFDNYEYHYYEENFYYTTLSEMRTDIKSTTQKIYLKKPNNNLREGQYILDSRLQLETGVSAHGNIDPNFLNKDLELANLMGERGINESTHTPLKLNNTELIETGGRINKVENNYTIVGNASERNNYFFGKLYNTYIKGIDRSKNGFYFVPKIKIVKVIDSRIIETNASVSSFLEQKDTVIQTINEYDSPLRLEVNGVVDRAKISKISNGKITKIDVVDPVNPNDINLPKILINNYQK